jgi:hypothetical protein
VPFCIRHNGAAETTSLEVYPNVPYSERVNAGWNELRLTGRRIGAKPFVMKVTVYRPRESVGLGSPQAFLGDEHPTQGDWVQSAKADLPDDTGLDPHLRLHLMGRAFLIYSMYHAREPRFLGYAVENFGAAAKKFGYQLPLKEEDAVWLTYLPTELDPGSSQDHQLMLGQIANVFGTKAAKEQADAIGVKWPARVVRQQGTGPSR